MLIRVSRDSHDRLAVPLEKYAASRESGGRECPLTDGGGSADP